MTMTRRQLVGTSVLAAAGLAAPALAAMEPTIPMQLGPFYPVAHKGEIDSDMAQIAGQAQPAKGDIIEVMGRVLGPDGRPVAGARVDIWQANAAGRYAHKGDDNAAPIDPGFQGFAVLKTDAEGRYRIRTVRPGIYPAGNYKRAAHIHFSVDGQNDRLITQMYFADDPWLGQDKTLLSDLYGKGAPWPAQIFGKEHKMAGATHFMFDIMLAVG